MSIALGGKHTIDDVAGASHLCGMVHLHLARATLSDLPYVMAIERQEGYDGLVGRWDEDKHRAAIADGRHAYFLGRIDDKPIGFAILRDWGSPECVTLLKRIAVSRPGHGFGKYLLRAVVEGLFQENDAHRLWLGVFPENLRARRAYESIGFVSEGVARGSAFFGGGHRDELITAILRTDGARSAAHSF